MEISETIIATIGSIVSGLILGLIGWLLSSIKNSKIGKVLLKITDLAKEFIIKAETFTNYTGTEKKQYVVTQIQKWLISNNIHFVNDEQISNIIEELVIVTNNVNTNKTKTN